MTDESKKEKHTLYMKEWRKRQREIIGEKEFLANQKTQRTTHRAKEREQVLILKRIKMEKERQIHVPIFNTKDEFIDFIFEKNTKQKILAKKRPAKRESMVKYIEVLDRFYKKYTGNTLDYNNLEWIRDIDKVYTFIKIISRHPVHNQGISMPSRLYVITIQNIMIYMKNIVN